VLPAGRAGDSDPGADPHYYSTAEPPADFPGPAPLLLARLDGNPGDSGAATPAAPRQDAPSPRLAVVPPSRSEVHPPTAAATAPKPLSAAADPIITAKQMIAEARGRYEQLKDYSCTFYKRERIDGRLGSQHIMHMKFRTKPSSVYVKFVRPNAGREAIFVAGRHGNKALVHDVGLGKLVAGTLALDPRGSRAMEDCRHPITEAGLGHLIEMLSTRWGIEMKPGETKVTVEPGMRVGQRSCTMIESAHPKRAPGYMFAMVRVYFDNELGLPIRFEAYDWPRRPGQPPELLEEYTYANLRLNVGLREADFDPSNESYSFGRF
jgi:hypothetical protein